MAVKLRAWVPCAMALSLMVAGDAGAGPREAHKLGVEAIDAGRWADAERFFRAAIGERSQEKVNRILKTTYLPHYYLGVALAELGFCKPALESWAESNRQGQIQKSDHFADLGRRRDGCQERLRRIKAARADTEELLARVDEASASLATLSATPELAPLWSQGAASFGSRQKSADRKLADAQERFDAKSSSGGHAGELERLDRARSLATSALSELNAALTDARRRLGELNAAIAAALEQLEEVEQEARRTLRSIADLAPYPRRLGSRVAAVERSLKEIRESKSGSSAQKLAELAGELDTSLRSLGRAARRPPKELSQAVEAFLIGAYADALALLDAPSLAADEQAKPHVCLIQAASRHALWVLGGEQDEALRDLAAEAITACVEGGSAAEPSPPPNAKFFSPRFVEFHVATLEALARSELEATRLEEGAASAETSSADDPASADSPEETAGVPATPASADGQTGDDTGSG